jgi:hypothetical protein
VAPWWVPEEIAIIIKNIGKVVVIAATATELIVEAKYASTTLNIVWKKKQC